MSDTPTTVHEAVGGDSFFVELIEGFYDTVATDPVLRPLYPDDLSESVRTLTLFLIQYWGGSTAYSDERGHPRLRMRHMPFVIGVAERDAWLRAMLASLTARCQERDIEVTIERQMRDYFSTAAEAMQNDGSPIRSGGLTITRQPGSPREGGGDRPSPGQPSPGPTGQ